MGCCPQIAGWRRWVLRCAHFSVFCDFHNVFVSVFQFGQPGGFGACGARGTLLDRASLQYSRNVRLRICRRAAILMEILLGGPGGGRYIFALVFFSWFHFFVWPVA